MSGDRPRRFTPALAFHALTPLYDRANDLLGLGRPFTNRVADALTLRGGEYLLDVGCGTGTLLAELRARHPHAKLVGIDVDVRVLRIAREKTGNNGGGAVTQAGAQTLPFRDASFDVVVSTLIFHHLPTETKRRALLEIYSPRRSAAITAGERGVPRHRGDPPLPRRPVSPRAQTVDPSGPRLPL